MSGIHALVAPSGLPLTMECAASLLLQLMADPVPESDEEAEGTAAHWHALQWASGNRMEVGTVFHSGGRPWTVDIDMVTGSKIYAYQTCPAGRFEDPVTVPQVHPTLCAGTPDYWQLVNLTPQFLKVVDYKFGHRYVDAFENWQLIAYALGVAARLGLPLDCAVLLVIVQPRAYHRDGPVKEWKTTVGALLGYAQRIAAQVAVALAGNPPARVGGHCIDCKARHLCTTLQRSAMHVVEFTGVAEAVELPPEALGQEARILHEALELLTARYKGLKTQIDTLARSGVDVPFWMLENGRALLKWKEDVSVSEVRQMGEALGLRLTKPEELVTPTQAKDAGVDEKVLEAYASRLPAGKVLKPATTTAARKVFGHNGAPHV